MSEAGCSGCGSGGEEANFDSIKVQMEETKKTLELLLNNFSNFQINENPLQELENKIHHMENMIQSDEFIEKVGKSSNLTPEYIDKLKGFKKDNAQEFDSVSEILSSLGKNKTPVGFVYMDENGEQKFSPVKPENVTSTPVYGS